MLCGRFIHGRLGLGAQRLGLVVQLEGQVVPQQQVEQRLLSNAVVAQNGRAMKLQQRASDLIQHTQLFCRERHDRAEPRRDWVDDARVDAHGQLDTHLGQTERVLPRLAIHEHHARHQIHVDLEDIGVDGEVLWHAARPSATLLRPILPLASVASVASVASIVSVATWLPRPRLFHHGRRPVQRRPLGQRRALAQSPRDPLEIATGSSRQTLPVIHTRRPPVGKQTLDEIDNTLRRKLLLKPLRLP
mmetsp:Transcript_1718/g.5733  ORF Transcript_1718/g.5733 Transcript_1718/m.5733 type:complete len:246 (+) Transcript_1718:853-1590(+)